MENRGIIITSIIICSGFEDRENFHIGMEFHTINNTKITKNKEKNHQYIENKFNIKATKNKTTRYWDLFSIAIDRNIDVVEHIVGEENKDDDDDVKKYLP